jgi:RNA polymerase sigma-54 factor
MAIELRQQLKLTQQLIMTPQLQMAIKLLQLSRLELMDVIRQEMEENPALEEIQEVPGADNTMESTEAPVEEPQPEKEVTIEEKLHEEIDWSNFIDEYNSVGRVNYESEDREAPKFEAFIAQKESLSSHLLWQLLMTSPSEEEQNIGSQIIGNLNRDGYLDISVEEIAANCGCPMEKVAEVLDVMQSFNPVGVCSRDLRECLTIQARQLGLDNTLVVEIIQNHLNHLENKNFKAIAKALKKSLDEVYAAVKVIQALEPRPGRQYSDEMPQYITPDIYVYKLENEFVILLNDDGMPKLRVNSYYKRAITEGEKISAQAKDYIQ